MPAPPRWAPPHREAEAAYYEGAEYVYYDTWEAPGTIIINTGERWLYHILGDGEATRYGVAVGKDGFQWAGIAKVGRKVEWPKWTPPTAMIKRRPELAEYANGMPGGPDNPLGARAMYLFENNRDTLFPHSRHQRTAIDPQGCVIRLHPHAERGSRPALRHGTDRHQGDCAVGLTKETIARADYADQDRRGRGLPPQHSSSLPRAPERRSRLPKKPRSCN